MPKIATAGAAGSTKPDRWRWRFPRAKRGSTPWNRGRKLPPTVLNRTEQRALMKQARGRGGSFRGERDFALIVLALRAGLRMAELLSLLPSDLDFEAGIAHVRKGKGSRSRRVALDPQTVAVMQAWLGFRNRWLRERGPGGVPRTASLFCTRQGRPLHPGNVSRVIARYGVRARIEKRVHAHALRHTCAFDMAREGLPLIAIQQQLGHANVSTTSLYINHLHPTELVAAVRERTWQI